MNIEDEIFDLLQSMGYDPEYDSETESFSFSVSVETTPKEWDYQDGEYPGYEDSCDEHEKTFTDILPDGWKFGWSGHGNTDSDGESTEDVYVQKVKE